MHISYCLRYLYHRPKYQVVVPMYLQTPSYNISRNFFIIYRPSFDSASPCNGTFTVSEDRGHQQYLTYCNGDQKKSANRNKNNLTQDNKCNLKCKIYEDQRRIKFRNVKVVFMNRRLKCTVNSEINLDFRIIIQFYYIYNYLLFFFNMNKTRIIGVSNICLNF